MRVLRKSNDNDDVDHHDEITVDEEGADDDVGDEDDFLQAQNGGTRWTERVCMKSRKVKWLIVGWRREIEIPI